MIFSASKKHIACARQKKDQDVKYLKQLREQTTQQYTIFSDKFTNFSLVKQSLVEAETKFEKILDTLILMRKKSKMKKIFAFFKNRYKERENKRIEFVSNNKRRIELYSILKKWKTYTSNIHVCKKLKKIDFFIKNTNFGQKKQFFNYLNAQKLNESIIVLSRNYKEELKLSKKQKIELSDINKKIEMNISFGSNLASILQLFNSWKNLHNAKKTVISYLNMTQTIARKAILKKVFFQLKNLIPKKTQKIINVVRMQNCNLELSKY